MENASLKAEIQRLRVENDELIKKVRFADSNAHYMRVGSVVVLVIPVVLILKNRKLETAFCFSGTGLCRRRRWCGGKME